MINTADILNAKVLVVDDQPANIRLLERILRDAGYTFITFTMSPFEVCGLHSNNRYDLILLDLNMPGMDGFEVMEGLREIEPDGYLPVIVITAQQAYKLRALEAGAKDFVSKPFDMLEVKMRIHNMLEVRLLYKERNRMDQILREKNAELESARAAAEKANLAKSDFLATVSHELRTPLTSIRGALALIAGGVAGELPAAAKPLIDIANKNSERLILLVNDILDMEKIEADKMEFNVRPVMLMPLLLQALEGNRAYAEQYKVGFVLDGDSLSGAMVGVDSDRMMQVMTNLLSNAAKYSPAGGKVLVAAARIGGLIRVTVADNGAGIPEEFRARIFQKFAQADSSDSRKKGGTGLGLSIVKALVEKMGGAVGFDSQPGVQTAFYVELPEWVDSQ
jgi:signal transduction histidine kinase